MIARRHVHLALLALLALVGLATVACEKVALLAPTGSTITLTASATTLPLNGTTTLIATVIESSGYPPHSGTQILFTTTLGTVTPATAETNTNGQVVVQYNAGSSSGTATITATSGGAGGTTTTGTGSGATTTNTGSNQVKIAVGAAAVGTVAIAASPGTVSANGGTSTVTASVRDTNGNALPGVPVTFTTDNGSLSAAVVNTDASGAAQTVITTNKTSKVTATAGVTGGSGSTAATSPSASVTINVNTVSAITVTASPSAPTAGQTVAFTLSQGTGGTAITRTVVDFGDGAVQSYSGLPSGVTHTYSSPGTYLVRVTATDTFGDTSSGSATVTVAPRAQPTVTISASSNPTPNTATTFTIAATPTTGNAIQSVTVDFGDGTQTTLNGNATSVQHVYASAGTYTVTAIATDSSGGSGSATTVIVVGGTSAAAPTAGFTISPTAATAGVTVVNFNGADSTGAITGYAWDFGDGTTGTGSTTTHTYTKAGTYTVRLTVTDTAGRTATKTSTITVS